MTGPGSHDAAAARPDQQVPLLPAAGQPRRAGLPGRLPDRPLRPRRAALGRLPRPGRNAHDRRGLAAPAHVRQRPQAGRHAAYDTVAHLAAGAQHHALPGDSGDDALAAGAGARLAAGRPVRALQHPSALHGRVPRLPADPPEIPALGLRHRRPVPVLQLQRLRHQPRRGRARVGPRLLPPAVLLPAHAEPGRGKNRTGRRRRHGVRPPRDAAARVVPHCDLVLHVPGAAGRSPTGRAARRSPGRSSSPRSSARSDSCPRRSSTGTRAPITSSAATARCTTSSTASSPSRSARSSASAASSGGRAGGNTITTSARSASPR